MFFTKSLLLNYEIKPPIVYINLDVKNKGLPDYVKLNHKIRLQDDFYAYACHHWCEDNPLPSTKSRWSVFNALNDEVKDQIRDILNDWLKTERKDLTPTQIYALDYYQAFIDKDKNLVKNLEALEKIRVKVDLPKKDKMQRANLLAKMAHWGIDTFFELDVDLDGKNNQRYCLTFEPPALDLPDRDYYLSQNAKMKAFRKAYLDFLQTYSKALNAAGFKYELNPVKILEIETVLAELTWPIHLTRDSEKTYNIHQWSEFCEKFDFDWQTYFKTLKIKPGQDIIVSQPSCLRGSLKYFKKLSDDELQAYCLHKIALSFGSLLSEKIAKLHFNFFGTTLSGTKKIEPLEKRASDSANRTFCDVFGQDYVKRHFPVEQKEEIQRMAENVSQSLRKRLGRNSWMSAPSRQYAQNKLDEIIVNIGYSEDWMDYDDLELNPENAVQNILQIISMERRESFNMLEKKPNRRKFGDLENNVQLVNAWTNLVLLNTNYPAAFLQAPFYDKEASFEYNLGSLGSVIGHELTHNFDDRGSQYDESGHLNPWLSKEEKKTFQKAAKKLIKQANKHHPTPKMHMKGKQVIGELIADLGGLEIVLDIVKDKYEDKEERREALRTVFIAYAFTFAVNETLQSKIMLTKAGVHPNAPFRVNGIVAHCEDFYEVFDVKEGDNLYLKPDERVLIW